MLLQSAFQFAVDGLRSHLAFDMHLMAIRSQFDQAHDLVAKYCFPVPL